MKGCVFKAGSKVENLSIHSQKMRTFCMISLTFFVLSNIAQSSANLVRGCSCSKSGQTLIPGNEARPINPFPLSFFASCFISRAAKTGLSLLRNQTETLAAQVISDVPLLPEIFRWNDSTQKAVFHFNILSNRVIRNLSVNGPRSNP